MNDLLTQDDINEFKKNWYIVKNNYLSQELTNLIINEVQNTSFGQQHQNYGKLRKDKRFEKESELTSNIKAIYNQYILPISQKVLQDFHSFSDAQYSLIESGRPSTNNRHIDGTWIAKDKNSFEGIPFFKLLIGIYLTDLSKPSSGNFMVSPWWHRYVEKFFQDINPSLLDTPWEVFDKVYAQEIPPLTPLLVSPGDIVIAHSLLPHSIDANIRVDRPVLYFRCGNYKVSWYPALANLWHEWPSL